MSPLFCATRYMNGLWFEDGWSDISTVIKRVETRRYDETLDWSLAPIFRSPTENGVCLQHHHYVSVESHLWNRNFEELSPSMNSILASFWRCYHSKLRANSTDSPSLGHYRTCPTPPELTQPISYRRGYLHSKVCVMSINRQCMECLECKPWACSWLFMMCTEANQERAYECTYVSDLFADIAELAVHQIVCCE